LNLVVVQPTSEVVPSPEELEQAKKSPDDDLEARLGRMHEEAVARARHEPLPATVSAYREVYRRLPEGWPHPDT
jgi:hypothetical protein